MKLFSMAMLTLVALTFNSQVLSQEVQKSKAVNECVDFESGYLVNKCDIDIWVRWWWENNDYSTCRSSICSLPVAANSKQTISRSKGNTVFAACRQPHKAWSWNPIEGDDRFYCANRSYGGETNQSATKNIIRKPSSTSSSSSESVSEDCERMFPSTREPYFFRDFREGNSEYHCGNRDTTLSREINEAKKFNCSTPYGMTYRELEQKVDRLCY